MQGRLRNQKLEIEIATSCAHCGRAMRLKVDERLHWHAEDRACDPHLFLPAVDWTTFREPNIIGHY